MLVEKQRENTQMQICDRCNEVAGDLDNYLYESNSNLINNKSKNKRKNSNQSYMFENNISTKDNTNNININKSYNELKIRKSKSSLLDDDEDDE